MTIGKRLTLGFGVILILAVIIGAVGINSLSRTNSIWKQAWDIGRAAADEGMRFTIELLNARRSEKDFKLRYKDKGIEKAKEEYITIKFAKHVANMHKKLDELKAIETKAGEMEDVAKIEEKKHIVDVYASKVLETVKIIEKMGYKDTGLLGKMRDSISKVEEEVQKAGLIEIEAVMLQVRRDEKDFLLREEGKYAKKHKETVENLKSKINASNLDVSSKSNLLSLVDVYQTDFMEVVKVNNVVKEMTGEYRDAAHELESFAAEVAEEGGRMAERDIGRALAIERPTTMLVSVSLLLAIILGFTAAIIITRGIVNPVTKLKAASVKLGKGRLDTKIDIDSKDEIGSLAESFNRMRISLQTNEENLLQETKLKTAVSELNDHMRGDLELVDLGNNILSYLVPHLDAQIGALYLMETGSLLKLISSYACAGQKNLPSEFKLGESLVGQAAMDKGAIILSKVPEGYFDISTGLGGIVPRNILILPLQYEGMVKGIIELGSVNEFSDKEVDFLNQVAGNIAISIHIAQSRKQMQELLEESQMQAEELQSREEGMLANNE